MKNITIITLIIVLALGFILMFSLYKNSGSDTPPVKNIPADNEEVTDKSDVIIVTSPKLNDLVTSPISIKGKNKGWYFEGSFGVKLLDATGKILGTSYVQADSEWMSMDWVPFTGTLEYNSPIDTIGTLVFEKDNPSGLPQYNDSYSFPVRIAKSETMIVKVFFNKPTIGVESCDEIQIPSNRTIPKTTSVARAAILELLKGPTTNDEISQKLTTSIPSGTTLNSIEIRNDTAYVDFNESLDYQVGGSCRVQAIRAQIEDTLKQFSTVKKVVISINGKTDLILQP